MYYFITPFKVVYKKVINYEAEASVFILNLNFPTDIKMEINLVNYFTMCIGGEKMA